MTDSDAKVCLIKTHYRFYVVSPRVHSLIRNTAIVLVVKPSESMKDSCNELHLKKVAYIVTILYVGAEYTYVGRSRGSQST